jgi:hypothetical protein
MLSTIPALSAAHMRSSQQSDPTAARAAGWNWLRLRKPRSDPASIPATQPMQHLPGMDGVRQCFWDAFKPMFPPHSVAVQTAGGSLMISWSTQGDPNATYRHATPVVLRFEPELVELVRRADGEQRRRIVAHQEQVLRSGLVGYDPYATVPNARVVVLG